jgi:hypothetical protein
MRRAIAISLMMLFSWTLIAPFVAPTPTQISRRAAAETASITA